MAIDNVDKARPMREVESDLVDVVNDLVDTENAFNVITPKTVLTPPASTGNAVTIGNGAYSTHTSNTAVGNNAKAIGNPDATAYGDNARCYNNYSVAIGKDSKTTDSYQFSVGGDKSGIKFTRRLSFVSTPTEDDDAATKAYVDAHSGGTIEDGSVTTAKLASGAVTTGKLSDGSVTGVKIASGAITTTKVADKTINEAKLTDALSIKLNERKGIEVQEFEITVGVTSNVSQTITFNQTHTQVPAILVGWYGESNEFLTYHIDTLSTTKCILTVYNSNKYISKTWNFWVVIIDRG